MNIGNDGQWLLKRLEDGSAPAGLKDLAVMQILKTYGCSSFEKKQGRWFIKI